MVLWHPFLNFLDLLLTFNFIMLQTFMDLQTSIDMYFYLCNGTCSDLVPVLQKLMLDYAIHWVNHHPVDTAAVSIRETNCAIHHWIEIYVVDRVIHLFNNCSLLAPASSFKSFYCSNS